MPWESAVEKAIREATERGEFDDLPGKGKPLPRFEGGEDWWVRRYVEREGLPADALLPVAVQLRKETERLPETVRDLPTEESVRRVVADLNARIAEHIRNPEGPRLPLRKVEPGPVIEAWRTRRAERGEALRQARAQEAPRRRRRR
ncbi:DUF1992 domain-containing protein [Pseudonocardia ailaonensis]|uniref:DUF1992 domain-containing protein n=1 Tax=Pseudonocardia ailaonensis TaxID=367279 RepID=A0ABN2NKN0_9PSEU